MYKTILVPTDCSGFDREAVRVALRLAQESAAKVHLVRVSACAAFTGMLTSADVAAVSPEVLRDEIDRELAELYALASECRSVGKAELTTSLEHGPVAEALAGYANRHQADLIVISTHGRSGFARFSLGSVTDSLIRATKIPVLVVKPSPSYLDPQVKDPFRRIVVPLDGSSLAEQVLPRITTLAGLEGSELRLLYVLKPQDYSERELHDPTLSWWEKDIESAQAYLFPMASKLRHRGFAVSSDVVIGENVAEKIAEFARTERADLIAIATHGRGGLSRLFYGSVADALTRCAQMSVLVFHPDSEASAGTARPLAERLAEIVA